MRAMLKKYVSEDSNGMGPVWPERRGHLPAWKLAELMDERNHAPNWEDFWSFSVVRNPFDRAVSLWTYCAAAGGRKLWEGNFKEWVRAGMPAQFGGMRAPLFIKQVWGLPVVAPQVAWVYPWQHGAWWDETEDRLVQCIFRFEDGVGEAWDRIWHTLGNLNPAPECKHANQSERHRDYREYYDKRTLDRVAMLYDVDLEAFEYEVPEL